MTAVQVNGMSSSGQNELSISVQENKQNGEPQILFTLICRKLLPNVLLCYCDFPVGGMPKGSFIPTL